MRRLGQFDAMEKSSMLWKRWLFAGPAMLFILYIASVALSFGASNLSTLEAQYTIDSRIKRRLPIDAPTLNKARALLENAISWNSANGTAHENLALVHRMRLGLPRLNLVERREALDLALRHILISAMLRPTSAYTYSLVAQIKHMRGERDSVFHKALIQAAHYGPWEPRVQDNVIEVGARAWSALNGPEKDVVRQAISRALEERPDEAREFLIARRWVLPPCGDLQVKIPDLCK